MSTLSHTAMVVTAAALFLIDPSRALQGRVDSPHTQAISARSQGGEDVLLNRTGPATGSAVSSATDGDIGVRALLVRVASR
jgi:hypothetical protein